MEMTKIHISFVGGRAHRFASNGEYDCIWWRCSPSLTGEERVGVKIFKGETKEMRLALYLGGNEFKIEAINELIKETGFELTTEKPRWRAERNGHYWLIDNMSIALDTEMGWSEDDDRYLIGNYFKTKEEAEEKLERFKEMLKED